MIIADSRALRERIFDAFPVTQPAFARLLELLDIEATDAVPTAAVTLGVQSRRIINPGSSRRCGDDPTWSSVLKSSPRGSETPVIRG